MIADDLRAEANMPMRPITKGRMLKEAAAEIERLRNLAADLMELAEELPIKHPQQDTRRRVLRGQCEQFGICQQQAVNSEEGK